MLEIKGSLFFCIFACETVMSAVCTLRWMTTYVIDTSYESGTKLHLAF